MSSSEKTLSVEGLAFSFEHSVSPLFENLQFELASGWTGICGVNGCGKTTLLRLIAGELTPHQGLIRRSGALMLCEQRTDQLPLRAMDLIEDYSPESYKIRGNLGIEDDWIERWDSLSHGERKRFQVAVALWTEPDILLLDEPTNHLDREGCSLMIRALKSFPGIGLIVTHDRELLDRMCSRCLWLRNGYLPVLQPGGYTEGKASLALEQDAKLRAISQLEKEEQRLQNTSRHFRTEASKADRKRSNRGEDPKDNDARARRNLARVSNRDGIDGKRLRQMEGRLRHLMDTRAGLRTQRVFEMGIWMDFQLSQRNTVYSAPSEILHHGGNWTLEIPRIELSPDQQFIIRGPNGSGKSTFLRHLLSGQRLPASEMFYLPQEIPTWDAAGKLQRIKLLEKDELGKLMQIVRRLGSDPGRLLESEIPSPGELRKLLFATGILSQPSFMVLDEPTNHLDLPSVECLQGAMQDCPCGYLIVSHDERFCEALNADFWEITQTGASAYELKV